LRAAPSRHVADKEYWQKGSNCFGSVSHDEEPFCAKLGRIFSKKLKWPLSAAKFATSPLARIREGRLKKSWWFSPMGS
jgi:hypothetical protein